MIALKRWLWILTGILIVAGCSPQPPDHTLVVGMDLSYPPFESIDPSGAPEGVSVELARALGDNLDRPVRIENIPFIGLVPALKSGRIDLVISSMTDTPERRKSIAFSDPYLTIGLALLVGRDSSIQGLDDLDREGRRVAVRQGTTGEVWAREHLRQAEILALDKESAAVMEVAQGRADAFIYDQMSVWKQAQRHSGRVEARLEPLQTEHWAIGLRADDDALRAEVNAFLEKFRADGGFDRLGDQFLQDQKRAFKEQGLEFYF